MTLCRIVLDTNVLVSAILFKGPPRHVLSLVITGTVECALSTSILEELEDVLQRPKFGFPTKQAMGVVEELRAICDVVSPVVRVDVIDADPDDNRVLECALKAKVDFIVSGDAHLLKLKHFKGIPILSPRQLLEHLNRR